MPMSEKSSRSKSVRRAAEGSARAVDKEIRQTNTRLSGVKSDLDDTNARLGTVETTVEATRDVLETVKKTVDDTTTRLDTLLTTVNTKLDAIEKVMNNSIVMLRWVLGLFSGLAVSLLVALLGAWFSGKLSVGGSSAGERERPAVTAEGPSTSDPDELRSSPPVSGNSDGSIESQEDPLDSSSQGDARSGINLGVNAR